MGQYSDFRIILDIPAAEPQLSFQEYGQAFKDIIEGSEPRFSIGLFGGWGTGKTTLMDRIRRELDPDRCVSVEFSAWRYEKEEHLIVPLLDTIRDALNEWSKRRSAGRIREAARKTARTIGGVTEAILRGFSVKAGIPKLLDVSFDANKALTAAETLDGEEAKRSAPRSFYFASFKSLKSAFAEFHAATDRARIVVFIDDLDRCLPEGALEVLESMKLFFDFDGFVFVVGLDQQVVEWCIDNRYAERQSLESEDGFRIRGADYIKKIFQVPFALPPVGQNEADQLLQAIIDNVELVQDQVDDLKTRVRPHLEHFLAGGTANLRDIKRFLNSYVLIMKVHERLEPDVVLALQTVAFTPQWRPIFEALRVHGEELARELGNLVQGHDHCIGEIAPELGTIPLSFERYVQNGAPGSVLLNRGDLALYINLATSATATDVDSGSSYSYVFIEMLRDVAKARRVLIGVGPLMNAGGYDALLREVHESVSRMEKGVESLRSLGGAEGLAIRVRGFLRQLDALLANIGTLAVDSIVSRDMIDEAEKLHAGLSEISEAIRQMKSRARPV